MKLLWLQIHLVIFCYFLMTTVYCTLSKSDKKKKSASGKIARVKSKISDVDVFSRGLVSDNVKYADVTREHDQYSHLHQNITQFPGAVLAYVTPWNNHGYDVAKIFATKFTYVSPVWLQIKRRKGGTFSIEGGHDIDKGWISDVITGRKTQIVPRLLFDGWSLQDYDSLFSSEDQIEDCLSVVIKFFKKYKFKGAVLEVWSQLGGHRKKELIHFLTHATETFHKKKMILILVIPPSIYDKNTPGMFNQDDFLALSDSIDYFSLMTYDFSNPSRPGPNSPISWVERCVLNLAPEQLISFRHKILLGLNFYGNDYSMQGPSRPIIGREYISLLAKHKPNIFWHSEYKEHIFSYREHEVDHMVFYPTLQSVQSRLVLARNLGVGVSIWEIGQGLDYFYDLL